MHLVHDNLFEADFEYLNTYYSYLSDKIYEIQTGVSKVFQLLNLFVIKMPQSSFID